MPARECDYADAREEPWVPNVGCQVCIFGGGEGAGPSWDGGDYHANYSACEQFALCAHHARSTSALGPAVDVCFAATYFSTLVRDIGGDGESNAEVPGLQFDSGKFGVGLWGGGCGWEVEGCGEGVGRGGSVAVHRTRSQFPLLSLCSYPWLLSALKRLG